MRGPSFDRPTAAFATLVFLTSVSLIGSASMAGFGGVALFAASCATFFWLAAEPDPGAFRLALAAALAVGPTVIAVMRASWWRLSLDNLLVALFGAHGLLYAAPLLWAGFLGLFSLRHERPGLFRLALAAIVPGTLSLLLATDPPDAPGRAMSWVPFLLPGIAQCFEKARAFAARRPQRVLAGVSGVLVLWNVLFMEQYRRRLLPSDDTVSFAQVTSNSAGLLSHAVGTPFAWPANWIFARRFRAPLDQWDAIADRRLFPDAKSLAATIEFGDDASIFAPDAPLLLEGFGARRTCEQGWCRDLDGAGRLLLPLQNVGRGDLVIRLRARGEGALSMSLNGANIAIAGLTASLSDAILRVPARLVAPGINVLSLAVAGGGKATIDRLTLERDLASGSAR